MLQDRKRNALDHDPLHYVNGPVHVQGKHFTVRSFYLFFLAVIDVIVQSVYFFSRLKSSPICVVSNTKYTKMAVLYDKH